MSQNETAREYRFINRSYILFILDFKYTVNNSTNKLLNRLSNNNDDTVIANLLIVGLICICIPMILILIAFVIFFLKRRKV